nr:DEAD/DEAH box helicase family protein [Burkholderia ubonensis]
MKSTHFDSKQQFPNEFPFNFTKLPLDPELIARHARVLGYANGLMGSGKTYIFINEIALPHYRNQHNSVAVYCAPSEPLIEQVEKDALAAGIPPTHLFCVLAKHCKGRVADRFRDHLIGSSRRDIKRVPDGSIILITHECLARSEFDMSGKERAVLIYDEARACLQDNYHLRIPEEVYEYLTEPRIHPVPIDIQQDTQATEVIAMMITPECIEKPITDDDGNIKESIEIWRWGHRWIDPPTIDEIYSLLPSNMSDRNDRAKAIVDFLESVYSSSLDVFVSVYTKKGKDNKIEYIVNNVLSPARMFRKFAKVLILSAFFETSQMFHFLHPTKQFDTRTPRIAVDVTQKYLKEARMKKLFMRLFDTTISYIFDLKGNSLTKTSMQHSIVLEGWLSDEEREEWNKKWHAALGDRPESYRTIFNEFKTLGRRATHSHDNERAAAFEVMQNLGSKYHLHGSVIRYMTRNAIALQQTFLQQNNMPCETLPIAITPRFNHGAHRKETTLWDDERLDDFNLDREFDLPDNREVLTKLPIAAHGMNEWAHLHSAAFLASMKYNIYEKKFLNRIIPLYDPDIDRTLDYAFQILWRCAVRDANADGDPCILIVTDREVAERLRARLIEMAKEFIDLNDEMTREKFLRITSPQKLLKNFAPPSLLAYSESEDSRKERNKQYNKNKRKALPTSSLNRALKKFYDQTPDGKAYNSLSVRISKNRAKGVDPVRLLSERARLMTLAQWKKSEEGLAARAELLDKAMDSLPAPEPEQSDDPIEQARNALNRLDGTKLVRDDRLKALSICKRISPTLESDCRAWYRGDRFDHNWKYAEKNKRSDRLKIGWLLFMAKKYPV